MKIHNIKVELEGIADLMFNRFIDHSKEIRPPEQKLYLDKGNVLVMPAENIDSMLVRQEKPMGAIKLVEKVKAGNFIPDFNAHVAIKPMFIPILQNGKSIIFDSMDDDRFYLFMSAGITKSSTGTVIKQEAVPRPTLKLPWSLEFNMTLIENPTFDQEKLRTWLEVGGIKCALGSHRNKFGRFIVKKWEIQ